MTTTGKGTVYNLPVSPGTTRPILALGKSVSIQLCIGGYADEGEREILGTAFAYADDTGKWSIELDANDADDDQPGIDPAGTYYTVVEVRGQTAQAFKVLPSVTDNLRALLVDNPTAPPVPGGVSEAEFEAFVDGLPGAYVSGVEAQSFDDGGAQARENIGAGDSSFSGAYADLSGKPTLGTAASHAATDFDPSGAAASALAAAEAYASALLTGDAYSKSNRRAHTNLGDSLTAGGQDRSGVTYPSVLAALLGSGVIDNNQGIQGYTSTEVAILQGAIPVTIGANFTLPADTSHVTVTVSAPTADLRTGVANYYTLWTGTLAGQPVFLQRTLDGSGANPTWTAWRTTSKGSTTSVTLGQQFVSTALAAHLGDLTIIMVGENNRTSHVATDVQSMVAYLTPTLKRYLVLPVFNTLGETSGSAGYIAVAAVNTALAAAFGANYFDAREWLIQNGLGVDSLTPTSADLAAIAADTIPPQLRINDGLHLNLFGYRALAVAILGVLVSYGWAPDKPAALSAVPGYVPSDLKALYLASDSVGVVDGNAPTNPVAPDFLSSSSAPTLPWSAAVLMATNGDGRVFRINGSGSGYFYLASNDPVSTLILRLRVRSLPTSGNSMGLGYSDQGPGPVFRVLADGSVSLNAGGGTITTPGAEIVAASTQTVIGVLNGASSVIKIGANAAVTGSIGTEPWNGGIRIGYDFSNSQNQASLFDYYEIVYFNRALTTAEMASVVAFYGGT